MVHLTDRPELMVPFEACQQLSRKGGFIVHQFLHSPGRTNSLLVLNLVKVDLVPFIHHEPRCCTLHLFVVSERDLHCSQEVSTSGELLAQGGALFPSIALSPWLRLSEQHSSIYLDCLVMLLFLTCLQYYHFIEVLMREIILFYLTCEMTTRLKCLNVNFT